MRDVGLPGLSAEVHLGIHPARHVDEQHLVARIVVQAQPAGGEGDLADALEEVGAEVGGGFGAAGDRCLHEVAAVAGGGGPGEDVEEYLEVDADRVRQGRGAQRGGELGA